MNFSVAEFCCGVKSGNAAGKIGVASNSELSTGVPKSRGVREANIMNVERHQFLHLVAAAAAAILIALSGHEAWSQASRTIKIVVPYPPAGGNDILARLLAEQISRVHGPTIVIENRPGAGTTIGSEAVARATPDGNTLLLTSPDLIISSHLRKLNYHPLTSFEPICYLATSALVVAVNGLSRYSTLADLVDAAHAKPGELTLASNGPATVTQIAFAMLKRAANLDMTYVPFPGTAPAITALLGEHLTAVLVPYPALAEHLNAGKLRALAIATRTRSESLPAVPTVAEVGYKDYEADSWYGIFAPTKTPKEAVAQLAGWLTATIQVPEMKTKLDAVGLSPVGTCGADFGNILRKQYEEYGRVIREAKIKAE
jgi:tripartite-type tricarboxylate transporter receptor subunit TctC